MKALTIKEPSQLHVDSRKKIQIARVVANTR